jgi:hypothetical protein
MWFWNFPTDAALFAGVMMRGHKKRPTERVNADVGASCLPVPCALGNHIDAGPAKVDEPIGDTHEESRKA